jgi:23S rRNA (uracil1939-C5)-methyltransferase
VLTLDETIARGTVDVTIEGQGFQGEGWVRLDDGWLSVRGALPGERVRVEVQDPGRWRGRRIWGRLLRVATPSDRRRDPQCSKFPGCRGCHLRHVSVLDELGQKSETIAECIEKYAGLPREAQPVVETIAVRGAARADPFRIRTNLTVAAGTERWDVGLRADEELVDMVDCPALADSTRRAVERFERALAAVSPVDHPSIELVRIAAPVHGHGYVDVRVAHDDPLDSLLGALDSELPDGFGLAVATARDRRFIRGPERIRLPMADLRLEVGYDDWFHATLEPAEALYDAIAGWLQVEPGETVLDAGCGVGTIGLLCAQSGGDVVGFDLNAGSVETAELNAMRNELDVRFLCGAWERVFRKLTMKGARFRTVVINPMRDPLGRRALAYLRQLDAERVLYLGPSPAPSAKDIAVLRDLGFEIARLGAVNLHPATYHVMLAALLTR